jgi:hypothetical protein
MAGPGWPSIGGLLIRARGYTGSREALAVMVAVNGRDQGTMTVGGEGSQFLPLTGVELSARGILSVAFTSAVASPRDFGSADRRRLGLGLVRIEFRSLAAAG